MKRLEYIAGQKAIKCWGGAGSRFKMWKLSEVSGTETVPIFKLFTLKMGADSVFETLGKFKGLSAQEDFVERYKF
jgi:hypothetical protein